MSVFQSLFVDNLLYLT